MDVLTNDHPLCGRSSMRLPPQTEKIASGVASCKYKTKASNNNGGRTVRGALIDMRSICWVIHILQMLQQCIYADQPPLHVIHLWEVGICICSCDRFPRNKLTTRKTRPRELASSSWWCPPFLSFHLIVLRSESSNLSFNTSSAVGLFYFIYIYEGRKRMGWKRKLQTHYW